jgi:hypothetical protein
MTIGCGLSGVGVVSDFIGAKNVDAVMNLSFAMLLIDGASLLLRNCADGHIFFVQRRGRIGQVLN